ncbi:MAG: hypothetical protein HKN23_03280 [Verrucomicrobiales bacterium]|nr:hypothetical protein [Verrucomicrobiales bacterium]
MKKVAILGFTLFACSTAMAGEPWQLIHSLIKPGPGESRWMEIDWYPTVWEGWKAAAEQGKPIFFNAGSGGAPCAGC